MQGKHWFYRIFSASLRFFSPVSRYPKSHEQEKLAKCEVFDPRSLFNVTYVRSNM